MPRSRIEDEYTEFFDWARASNRVSPGVAKAYCSAMRRIARSLPDFTNQAAVNGFFQQASESDDTYTRLRAAWSLYIEYHLLTTGETLPQPYGHTLLRSKAAKSVISNQLNPLPDDVREALRVVVANGISINIVFTLTWFAVAIKDMMSFAVTHVKLPGKSHQNIVPSNAMKALWNYAQPGDNLYVPIVPLTPGSSDSYPLTALRREMATVKAGSVFQYTPNDTSVLGIAALRKAGVHPSNMPSSIPMPTTTTADVLRLLGEPPGPALSTSSPATSSPSFGDYDEDDPKPEEVKKNLSSLLAYDPNSND